MPPHATSAACSPVPVIFIAELDLLTLSQLPLQYLCKEDVQWLFFDVQRSHNGSL